jgi:hypothetical protein
MTGKNGTLYRHPGPKSADKQSTSLASLKK